MMAILKLIHVLSLFVWIGSLLTLTRFSAYLPKEGPYTQERLLRILVRIYRFVDLPALIIALITGLILLSNVQKIGGWFHMKATFAFLLIVSDVTFGRWIQKAKIPLRGRGTRYKILHTLVALFLIGALTSIYLVKNHSSSYSVSSLSK